MITPEIIDKVRDIDIVSIISKHVKLKQAGSNLKGYCPVPATTLDERGAGKIAFQFFYSKL